MINGNSVVCQLAKESVYGTVPAAMTRQMKPASESLKPVYNRISEGVATGGRGAAQKSIMSIKTEGALSILARPDDAGIILSCLCGVEADPVAVDESTEAYKHTFTAIGTSLTAHLPSLSVVMNRIAAVKVYNGQKIDNVSFSASQEDYLKLEINFVGRDEKTGTVTAGLVPSVLRAFRFKHGHLSIAGTAVADINSFKFDWKNNLDSSVQTTGTGDYFVEPECGTREITVENDLIYSADSDAIRELRCKSDDTCAVVLDFVSDDMADSSKSIPYELKLTIPCCQASGDPANMSGLETLKHTITFEAVDNLTDELATFELTNTQSAKY